MDEFNMQVKATIPVAQYRRLVQLAKENKTTVSALVAEMVNRGFAPSGPKRRGPQDSFKPHHERMLREFDALGYSAVEIGRRMGFNEKTIRAHKHRLGLTVFRLGRMSDLERERARTTERETA